MDTDLAVVGSTLVGDRRPRWGRGRRAAARSADRGLAIDFGTSMIRIGTVGRVLVEEPTVVARDMTGRVVAVGEGAHPIIGRNPRGIEVVEPVAGGTIVDHDLAAELLRLLLRHAGIVSGRGWRTAVVSVPLSATGLHHRALLQSVQRSLPKCVLIPIEAPMAAAIGAGLPVERPLGSMVVDVGRGLTEAAVVSLGSLVTAKSAPVGGASARALVTELVRDRYDLEIGQATAARMAHSGSDERIVVRGLCASSGLPRMRDVGHREIAAALETVNDAIVDVAVAALDAAPVALGADVMQGTIVLTGGASRMSGLTERLSARTGMDVTVLDAPHRAVIDGARLCLEGSVQFSAPLLRR